MVFACRFMLNVKNLFVTDNILSENICHLYFLFCVQIESVVVLLKDSFSEVVTLYSFQLGVVYMEMGNRQKAAVYFDNAVRYEPDHWVGLRIIMCPAVKHHSYILKAPYSSKIDILLSKKGLMNWYMIIKCGTWQPIKCQSVSHSWTGSKLKWFLSYLWINVGNMNSETQ